MNLELRNKHPDELCSICGSKHEECYGEWCDSIVACNYFAQCLVINKQIICTECMVELGAFFFRDYNMNLLKHEIYEKYPEKEISTGRKKKKIIDNRLKLQVYKRDGFKCLKCGSEEDLHMDHVIPESKGGETTLENLQVLCRKCNISKGTKTKDYRINK